jgi:hypothetical protein
VFKPIENFKARFVSSGTKHKICICMSLDADKDGLPYAWGDSTNSRFGKIKKGKADDTKLVTSPVVIEPFESEFKKLRKDLQYQAW